MVSKYYLSIVTFLLGGLIGRYVHLVAVDTNVAVDITSTSTNVPSIEKENIKFTEIKSAVSQHSIAFNSDPLSKEETTTAEINSVRLNSETFNDLYDDPKRYWHNALYLGESIDDKLLAIDELIMLQESNLLASGLGDTSTDIRIATIKGLTQIGDVNSVQLLGQALFTEQNETTHELIINALHTLSYHDNAQVFLDYATKIGSHL